MGKKKKKKKKKKKIIEKNYDGTRSHDRPVYFDRPPPHHCVRVGARTPPLARPLHRCRSLVPRRLPRRGLRVGHLWSIDDTGGSRSQPRARAYPRAMGNGRVTRGSPPRATLSLCRDPPGRTSLVQG